MVEAIITLFFGIYCLFYSLITFSTLYLLLPINQSIDDIRRPVC